MRRLLAKLILCCSKTRMSMMPSARKAAQLTTFPLSALPLKEPFNRHSQPLAVVFCLLILSVVVDTASSLVLLKQGHSQPAASHCSSLPVLNSHPLKWSQ